MIYQFDGVTASEVWLSAASTLLREGCELPTSRGGPTREILHAVFTIEDPRQRWVLSRYPAINPAFAIAEVIWILNGRKDSAFLNYWNSQLPKYAGNSHEYYGAYGYRLRSAFGMDQLERAYLALRHNPDSRQVVLDIWHAALDMPCEDGEPADNDIPCNITSLLKIRDGRLEWMQVVRSNDLFRGVPYNFIQFTTLQEVMAGWLGVGIGCYHQLSDSLHIYAADVRSAITSTSVSTVRNVDDLCLPKASSDEAFSTMCTLIESMIEPSLSQAGLLRSLDAAHLPVGYRNMMLIVAAEAARRRGWQRMSEAIVDQCTNRMLVDVWGKWLERFAHQIRV